MFISMPVSAWRERQRERQKERDRDRDRETETEINTLIIYNKCVITILYTLRYPYEKAMAFGGVATGNMKA